VAHPTIAELTAAAAAADEPLLVAPGSKNFGGVDPLGLRQINFDLMDEVLPGLNNVARHVRPFVVVAWAWRRALQRAQTLRIKVIKQSELQDFVDRIEVLYVLSQILRDKEADLPGRQYLAPWLKDPEFRFGDAKWKKRREERKYSTALSAPINAVHGIEDCALHDARDTCGHGRGRPCDERRAEHRLIPVGDLVRPYGFSNQGDDNECDHTPARPFHRVLL
jgi:hypothetical protein